MGTRDDEYDYLFKGKVICVEKKDDFLCWPTSRHSEIIVCDDKVAIISHHALKILIFAEFVRKVQVCQPISSVIVPQFQYATFHTNFRQQTSFCYPFHSYAICISRTK